MTRIDGTDGNDTLEGGPGDDIINGGAGDNLLSGGEGVDRFVVMWPTTIFESSYNVILDFDPENELLDLRGLVPSIHDLIIGELSYGTTISRYSNRITLNRVDLDDFSESSIITNDFIGFVGPEVPGDEGPLPSAGRRPETNVSTVSYQSDAIVGDSGGAFYERDANGVAVTVADNVDIQFANDVWVGGSLEKSTGFFLGDDATLNNTGMIVAVSGGSSGYANLRADAFGISGTGSFIHNEGDIYSVAAHLSYGIRSLASNVTIENSGNITLWSVHASSGIYTTDANVNIHNSGDITTLTTSGYGIQAEDASGTIVNDGDISMLHDFVWSTGIYVDAADHFDISNSGAITADVAVHMRGNAMLTNAGTLTGYEYAIFNGYGEPAVSTVLNIGVVEGDVSLASEVSHGNIFTNEGTVSGDITFTDGNDRYNGKTGVLNGSVDGGAGNDTLIAGDGDSTLVGGAGDDILVGGEGDDLLNGDVGFDTATYNNSAAAVSVNLETGIHTGGDAQNDTLSGIEAVVGSTHNDTLVGDTQDNNFSGGLGDDTFAGGLGADTMDGGEGQDMLDYTASGAGVMADLFRGRGRGGDAEGDRLSGFEDIAGSAHNDTLIGDADENRLMGGDGFDFFDGGAGADYIHGGGDQDRVNYGASSSAVHVSLDAGAGYSGDAEGDVLVRIEELVGSDYNDTLEGSTGRNKFWGGDGDDIISANDGPDVLYGEAGNDTLDGGAGRDIIIGGTGDDSITGGLGNDIIETGSGSDTLVYADGHGGDFITDFDITSDLLDLTAITGIASFADLNAEDGRMRSQDGVLLHTSSGDFVFIAGVTIGEIETATIVN